MVVFDESPEVSIAPVRLFLIPPRDLRLSGLREASDGAVNSPMITDAGRLDTEGAESSRSQMVAKQMMKVRDQVASEEAQPWWQDRALIAALMRFSLLSPPLQHGRKGSCGFERRISVLSFLASFSSAFFNFRTTQVEANSSQKRGQKGSVLMNLLLLCSAVMHFRFIWRNTRSDPACSQSIRAAATLMHSRDQHSKAACEQ